MNTPEEKAAVVADFWTEACAAMDMEMISNESFKGRIDALHEATGIDRIVVQEMIRPFFVHGYAAGQVNMARNAVRMVDEAVKERRIARSGGGGGDGSDAGKR